jgi:hypothetical protein
MVAVARFVIWCFGDSGGAIRGEAQIMFTRVALLVAGALVLICPIALDASQSNQDDALKAITAACPGVEIWGNNLTDRLLAQGRPPIVIGHDKEYIDELVEMKDEDQRDRIDISAEKMQDAAYRQMLLDADTLRLKRLRQIIDERGFPTLDSVGSVGIGAFFILVQHADTDAEFQSQVLTKLQLKDSGIRPDDLAMLIDRVRIAHGQPQLYGTQYKSNGDKSVPFPIEDEKNLAMRRDEMWLMPTADYECVLGILYKQSVATEK